ncbi:F-box C protein [Caenorhabditis elegans]|uniref:F-box C protein n=1 Tax=Caenorhabditis elegans TaxID=6239 RepID=O17100_CAEEL|nr:F-box C protein [Caenorhabditis elegans]CCD70283.1 F-box C protein [Caenorhabditis elegans]|eukprot:NP_494272.1 F-box C protein [Caenorhabditis elegans]
MNSSKPLSYPSIGSILQHLKPDKKFQLSQQCRTITSIDKSRPLYLKSLKLNENSIKLNGTTYELNVIENSLKPRAFPYDVNSQGSIDLEMVVPDQEQEQEILVDDRTDNPTSYNEQRISRADLKNAPSSSYTHYIRFSVGNHSEQLQYNERKLHDAMKYLIDKLLGGRPTIKARQFCVENSGILRIPRHLKIRAKVVQLNGLIREKLLNATQHLLDIKSLPLSGVIISDPLMNAPNLDIDFIQTAEMLLLYCEVISGEGLLKVRHKRVYINAYLYDATFRLFEDWMEHGREVGTHFSFAMRNEGNIIDVLDKIRINYNVEEGTAENQLTIHINNFTDIVVSHKVDTWILEYKVQQREVM